MQSLKGKKVLVMGLGLNQGGLSVAKFMHQSGASVTITDLKSRYQLRNSIAQLPKSKRITLVLGKHRMSDFTSADIIFRNPAVPKTSKYLKAAIQAGVLVTNEAAFFLKYSPARVVGITGTRGKSTTATLTAHILKQNLSNNIILAGNIASNGLLSTLATSKKNDVIVAEFSSFHLEHINDAQKSPQIAILTNLYKDHLNRYSSFQQYCKTKVNIFKFQRSSDIAIYNSGNATVIKYFKTSARKVSFSTKSNRANYFEDDHIIYERRGSKNTKLFSIPNKFKYVNAESILAATAVARAMHISPVKIHRSLKSAPLPRFRMQVLGRINDMTVINDSASTAPVAVIHAITHVNQPTVLILGGEDKGLPYDELCSIIANKQIQTIVIPGTASDKIIRIFKRRKFKNFTEVQSLRKAFSMAVKMDAEVLLFSPGAASFNMFVNEFDRGEQFTTLFDEKKKKKSS